MIRVPRWVLFPLLLALGAGCAVSPAPEATVTIRARVPEGTGTLYVAGNIPSLGPWDPGRFAMQGTGRDRTAVLRVPRGTRLEFKFTLGSWDREALGPSGTIPANHVIEVRGDAEAAFEIADFKKDPEAYIASWKDSGVLGRLDYWRDVRSQHLAEARHVAVWLPPGYDEEPARRYPVLYMHDGQNLFDPRLANTGTDWGVDEAVVRGMKSGRLPPLIVVGVFNSSKRFQEYSPWHDAPRYARFLEEELMPEVNRRYRTLTGPENTGAMGSSMGGLLSFYLCWKHSRTFGRCGCVSTHFPLSETVIASFAPDARIAYPLPGRRGEPLIEREIAAGAKMPRGVRLYFDYGTRGIDAEYEPVQAKVDAWLAAQGLVPGKDFVSRRFEGAEHNEAAWRARLDQPLEFLFGLR